LDQADQEEFWKKCEATPET